MKTDCQTFTLEENKNQNQSRGWVKVQSSPSVVGDSNQPEMLKRKQHRSWHPRHKLGPVGIKKKGLNLATRHPPADQKAHKTLNQNTRTAEATCSRGKLIEGDSAAEWQPLKQDLNASYTKWARAPAQHFQTTQPLSPLVLFFFCFFFGRWAALKVSELLLSKPDGERCIQGFYFRCCEKSSCSSLRCSRMSEPASPVFRLSCDYSRLLWL